MSRPGPLKLLAPAKINLYLEVTGRRADGYHTLRTLFARIGLADRLELTPAERFSLLVRQEGPENVPEGPDNLVWRAGEAFRRRFGGPAARIVLSKKVPSGAGLGGGSSDAAAVLRGLARWTPVPAPALTRLAAGLGADVPFFLRPEPVCAATGIGDRLRGVPARRLPWAVVVYPGVPVPTAEAFRRLAQAPLPSLTRPTEFYRITRHLKAGDVPSSWAGLLFNRLETPVFEMCPASRRAWNALRSFGAPARLSGSGSCVFALTLDEKDARRLAARVRRTAGRGWTVYAVPVG